MSDDSATVGPPTGPSLGVWGPLELLEEIGKGGFGRVYRAWDAALARDVALKIIERPDTHAAAFPALLREGQLLARVRHANVVTIHGARQEGDQIGLWMEFVRGRSLSDLVKREGPRAAGEAALMGISLCQALSAVHRAGVIHRDVKAHNVMRESGGRIVLMDFGAGQLLAETLGPDESQIGTPAYMAPEVLAGARASVASDLYALGVLLYYLTSGSYPIDGRSWTDFVIAHRRADRRALADVRPDLPASFLRIVDRASSAEPAARYQTPGAMLRDLMDVTGSDAPAPRVEVRSPIPPARTDPAPDADTGSGTWRAVRIGAAVAIGILALGTVTSVTFNHTLSRTGAFAAESVFAWWIWGVRALIPGAVYSTILLLALFLVRSVWKVLQKPVPATARLSNAARHRVKTLGQHLGLDDLETLAQAFLAAQIVCLGVFCWWFRDVFAAIAAFVESAPRGTLEPLRPEHFERQQNYNLAISLLILAMGAGLLALDRRFRARARSREARDSLPAPRHAGWRRGSLAVIAVAFVLLAAPYRLMWHEEVEVAIFESRRCYVLGASGPDVQLFCPTLDPPRTRIVARTSPHLQLTGVVESLYTRPPE